MTRTQPPSSTNHLASIRIRILATVCVTVLMLVPLIGVGTVAILAQHGSDNTWTRWSNVGDTFGAINSVLSGLALMAMIVIFWMQQQELREQRSELAAQRESLAQTQAHLLRSANANLRELHFELIKLSIGDPDLAKVWPWDNPAVPQRKRRQYMYANLIYQHMLLSLRSDYPEDQVRASLKHLFTSPTVREYWRFSSKARQSLVPGTEEFELAQMVDQIVREIPNPPDRPSRRLLIQNRHRLNGHETSHRRIWIRARSASRR
jgi:hypothetical protein